MLTKYSVQSKNKSKFLKSVELRKKGLSYTEIQQVVPVSKSTLNNWLTLAGLTLKEEHLNIQNIKRTEKRHLGIEASRQKRLKTREIEVNQKIQDLKVHFQEPLFIAGIILYEAEGNKSLRAQAGFSNSDFRLVKIFIKFIEKYFKLDSVKDMRFSLEIHETRSDDQSKIVNFWAKKLNISKDLIQVTWKTNIVKSKKMNPEYVGQMQVRLKSESFFIRKLLSISDILLDQYLKS